MYFYLILSEAEYRGAMLESLCKGSLGMKSKPFSQVYQVLPDLQPRRSRLPSISRATLQAPASLACLSAPSYMSLRKLPSTRTLAPNPGAHQGQRSSNAPSSAAPLPALLLQRHARKHMLPSCGFSTLS